MVKDDYNEWCDNCGRDVNVQIYKGTGYCSELCRKVLQKEIAEAKRVAILEGKLVDQ
jgi:endogenous inhibitor of DNA gyrase (YacG/DUF329 family)